MRPIVFVFATFTLLGCGKPTPPTPQAAAEPPPDEEKVKELETNPVLPASPFDEFIALVEKKLGGRDPNWSSLLGDLDLGPPCKASANVYYKSEPSSADAREDTKRLVAAMVSVLEKKGVSPGAEGLIITSYATFIDAGVGGRVHSYGRSMWNPYKFSIEYRADR